MLIDDVTIHVQAGHGGAGAVAFDKNKMSLGPTGGNGGNGGDVVARGASDINALRVFRHKKEIRAQDGKDGKNKLQDGHKGKDSIISVPVGTVIRNIKTGDEHDIVTVGETAILAHGGSGGKGNYHFRSSRNTTPQKSQPGVAGESFSLRLELRLIADIGLVGLPNAGKSTLLNELTNAKSRVANYNFTTLEPHLGAYYALIIADIPGLIEGASQGKGLGIKFLRHIERTRLLFHLISAESDDVVRDYTTLRNELQTYNPKLLEKPEYVFLSKSDTVSQEKASALCEKLRRLNTNVWPLSIIDDNQMKRIHEILSSIRK